MIHGTYLVHGRGVKSQHVLTSSTAKKIGMWRMGDKLTKEAFGVRQNLNMVLPLSISDSGQVTCSLWV